MHFLSLCARCYKHTHTHTHTHTHNDTILRNHSIAIALSSLPQSPPLLFSADHLSLLPLPHLLSITAAHLQLLVEPHSITAMDQVEVTAALPLALEEPQSITTAHLVAPIAVLPLIWAGQPFTTATGIDDGFDAPFRAARCSPICPSVTPMSFLRLWRN